MEGGGTQTMWPPLLSMWGLSLDTGGGDTVPVCPFSATTAAPAAATAAVPLSVLFVPPAAAPAAEKLLPFCAAAMRAYHAVKSLPASGPVD